MAKGIVGLDKLMKKYGELAEQAAGQAMERAVGASAKLVQAEAKLLCPVHDGGLRRGIQTMTEVQDEGVQGIIYNNVKHGPYVEFGTGPNGQESHEGIAPNVAVAYSQKGWMIPGDAMTRQEAEEYGLGVVEGKDGMPRGYLTNGQAAHPFMYPALKNNEERVTRNIANYLAREIRKMCEK